MNGDADDGAGRAGRRAPPLTLGTGLLVVVAVVLVGWALRATAVVGVPLAASILVALAVMPVRDRVRRAVPDRLHWLGAAAAVGVILVVLALFAGGLWLAARQVVGAIPAGEVSGMLDAVSGGASGGEAGQPSVAEGASAGATEEAGGGSGGAPSGGAPSGGAPSGGAPGDDAPPSGGAGQGASGELTGSAREALRTLGDRALNAAGGAAAAILNSALGVLGGLGVIVFLTLFILLESGDWRRKLDVVTSRRTEWRLLESAGVIAGKVRAYLLVQAGLGLVSAGLYAAWLSIWGAGLVFVWTLLIFLANFVPTIGSVVGGTLPVAYVLLTEGVGAAVGVGAGILVIEMVMGNLVSPRVQGRNISLSPLVVLVALLVWGWVWGIAGALLAVPVTVSLLVLGAHVPALRPWALMLSDQTDEAGLDEVTRP